jgi:RHS repeat-associated protein
MLTGKTISQNGTQKSNASYTYDKIERLQYVYENSSLTAEYTYDDNGNISGLNYSNGNSTEYTYNLANKLVSVANKRNGTTISQFTYTYYLDGNQAEKTDSAGTTSYAYDGLGRLSNVSEPGNIATSYTYDDYNNRSNKTVVDSTNTTSYDYSYDKQCKLLTEVKKVDNVVVSTTNYQYDNNGNMTSDGTNTYKYDGFNQLMEVTSGSSIYTYSYNGDGLRIAKVINGTPTNYIWRGDDITLETDASGATTANYVQGINLIASDIGSTRKYYMYNGHGDVVQLTGTDGNVAKTYGYDEFGIEKNIDSSDTNPFRYCGEYFDKETGTIYLRARYYDPATSRMLTEDCVWSSQDTLGNGVKVDDPLSLNLYLYCQDDPINYADPSGHTLLDIGFLVFDLGNLIAHPSWGNLGWLALDVPCFFDPTDISGTAAHVAHAAKAVEVAKDVEEGVKLASEAKNAVYISKDAKGVVQYVGITNDVARRAAEHMASKGIQIRELMGGLSRTDARAVEQTLIEINGLGKNSGSLMNKINSIAKSNSKYADALKRGYELLKTAGYK